MTTAARLHSALDWYVYGINQDQHYDPGFTLIDININGLDVYLICSGLKKMKSIPIKFSRCGLRTLRYMRHTTPR